MEVDTDLGMSPGDPIVIGRTTPWSIHRSSGGCIDGPGDLRYKGGVVGALPLASSVRQPIPAASNTVLSVETTYWNRFDEPDGTSEFVLAGSGSVLLAGSDGNRRWTRLRLPIAILGLEPGTGIRIRQWAPWLSPEMSWKPQQLEADSFSIQRFELDVRQSMTVESVELLALVCTRSPARSLVRLDFRLNLNGEVGRL